MDRSTLQCSDNILITSITRSYGNAKDNRRYQKNTNNLGNHMNRITRINRSRESPSAAITKYCDQIKNGICCVTILCRIIQLSLYNSNSSCDGFTAMHQFTSLWSYKMEAHTHAHHFNGPFLDPEDGSQNTTLVVLLHIIGISSLKIPKAFLICSAVQQNFATTQSCWHSPQIYRLRHSF